MPAATVGKILRRHGRSRRERPPVKVYPRYEREVAGDLIHIDVKRLGRFFTPGKRILGGRNPKAPKGRLAMPALWRSTITRAWPTPGCSPQLPAGSDFATNEGPQIVGWKERPTGMSIFLDCDHCRTTLTYPLFHPRSRRTAPLTLPRIAFAREFPAEGDHVEFKKGAGERPIRETAVAFSNTAGGVILVGVDDSGVVLGRALNSGTADAIHNALSHARDIGRYDVRALDVEGVAITVVSVARREEGFAQTSNGRVLVRRGTRDEPVFGADLQRLINERSAARFETTPSAVEVGAADSAALDRVRRAHGWGGDISPHRLEEIGLASAGRLTIAGVLCLHPDPARALGKAFVEILRYPSDETADYDRRDEVRGPVDHQIEETTRLIVDHLGTELVVLGVRRYDLPRIPEVVVREAVANAVAHRSYEASGTPVRVELRPSSVIVTSPGSLREPVTVANIREANAARNLDVMKTLRRLGLAEDAGRGVDVMQDTMRSEMLEPPQFQDTGHSVVVTLPVRAAVAPIERAWIRELETRGELAPTDRLVLVHAARGEELTNSVVRGLSQVDSHEARAMLQRLRDGGFLVQHGERGGSFYRLAESLRPPAGLRLGPADLADIVERLADGGPVANADVRAATGLDRLAALAVLDGLVRAGRLRRSGERRGTRYSRP